MNNQLLLDNLRCIPDWPIKGVNFRDVTTLFKSAECLKVITDEMYDLYKDKGVTKIVGIESRDVIVVDPMLATGGTANAAIQFLKNYGVKNIKLLSILAVPESISVIQEQHPDVDIYCAAIDEKLNDKGYIVPGA